jgi:hypothetical protein
MNIEPTPIFAVIVNDSGQPERIQFTGQREWLVSANYERAVMSPEVDWLCLLALLTAKSRGKLDSQMPCLSECNREHTKSIAEALCDKRNFIDAPEAPGDEIDDIDDARHWLLKVFGVPPRDKYLTGTRTSGSEKVAFSGSVIIEIFGERTKRLEDSSLLFQKEKITDAQTIEKIYHGFLRKLSGDVRRLSINLLCVDRGDPMSRESILGVGKERTLLDSNISFRIKIDTNYSCSVAVLWISSGREVYLVYPFHGLSKDPGYKKLDTGKVFELTVGVDAAFNVHPPEGFDHCVVMDRDEPFSKKDMEFLCSRVVESISEQNFSKRLRNAEPMMHTLRIAKNSASLSDRSYGGARFGTEDNSPVWLEPLARKIAGKANRLHVLAVPNRQS